MEHKRQINKAKEAQNSCQMMMFPSALDVKNAMKMNGIHKCHVIEDNINAAEDIFGEAIFALKGKTTQ